jgi:putative phage-type endonuclease
MFEEVDSQDNTNIKSLKKINHNMFEEVDSQDSQDNKVNDILPNITNQNIQTTIIQNKYELVDKPYNIVQIKDSQPFTNDFFLNKQYDDVLDDDCIRRRDQLRKLKAIVSPPQKSEEWYKLRRERITASDGGTIIGWNKYSSPYDCLLKKVEEPPFCGNENVFHGNKYEDCAALLYQDRMNVQMSNFGLLPHPTCPFLGASPDVIIDEYKLDGIHKTNLVGRMIEIKCPSRRKIITSGEIFDNQCSKYYWVQVQLQLECCDLDECDFIQCEIDEYQSWDDFVEETNPNEPYKSEIFGLEKGCIVQILPKNVKDKINYKTYDQIVYDNAKHIYPPTVYMSPYQDQQWIEQVKKDIETKPEYNDKYFDKVCHWRLEKMGCCTIKRDREWYAKYYPVYEDFWNKVLFFRKNKDKFELLKKYINLHNKPKYGWSVATNDNIQNVINILYNDKHPDYIKKIKKLEKDIEIGQIQKNDEDAQKTINQKTFVKNNTYVKSNNINVKSTKKICLDQFQLLDD